MKVQRPLAPRQIESDLALMRSAARFVRDRGGRSTSSTPRGLSTSSAGRFARRLDYLHEARNAEMFRRNFGYSEQVVIPKVWWRYTTQRVVTLEYLDGIQIRDVDVAARPPADRRALAYRMTDAWMTMIFRHGFFHGDPHPAHPCSKATASVWSTSASPAR